MKRHGFRIALVVLVLAGAAWPAVAGSDPALGRIFLTPEQRRDLDEQRARERAGAQAEVRSGKGLLPAGLAPRSRVALNGVVQREDGADVVWVNGQQVSTRDNAALVEIHHGPDGQHRIRLRSGADGDAAILRPGQTWDRATDSVLDCVQCATSAEAPVTASEPAESAVPDQSLDALTAADTASGPDSAR